MIGGLGSTELLLIFGLIVLLFGANKLPELARSMGTSMGEFKKAQKASEISVQNFEEANDISKEKTEKDGSKIKELAHELGISVENSTDEELLEEIHRSIKPVAN